MHYRNNRKSQIKGNKLTKPCPYHSRVSSTVESGARSVSPYNHNKSSSPLLSFSTPKSQAKRQIKLPTLVNNSRTIKTQPSLDPFPNTVCQRIKTDYNYYQDMNLKDQGWPASQNFSHVGPAKLNDIAYKAQAIVSGIYQDQYHNVRKELEIIRRVRERYEVIRNIQEDKEKLRLMLKRINRKKIYVDNLQEGDSQEQDL